MPEPNPNERRPTASGETPLQAAPPVPGAPPPPSHPEQRLGPAPALPVSGGWAPSGTAAERPLAPAPRPASPGVAGHQIPARPGVPVAGPIRPGSQETPLRGVTGGPVGSRPEVPLARPGEVRGAAWVPPSAVPGVGSAPAAGVAPSVPNPMALYGGATAAGAMPAGAVGQPPLRASRTSRHRRPVPPGSSLRRIRRRCRRRARQQTSRTAPAAADRLVAAGPLRSRGIGGHGSRQRKRPTGPCQDQHRQVAPPRIPYAFVGVGGDLPARSRHVPDRNGGRSAAVARQLTKGTRAQHAAASRTTLVPVERECPKPAAQTKDPSLPLLKLAFVSSELARWSE